MTLGHAQAMSLLGLDGHHVVVEAHLANALPGFTIVGLPDASLTEAKERVRAAIASCGLTLPPRKIVVNLALHHSLNLAPVLTLPLRWQSFGPVGFSATNTTTQST